VIFQEAIRNSARHSGASRLRLTLEAAHGEAVARIADNGRGLPEPLPDSGNGLANLRARAAALGGRFELVSQPGCGVEIVVRFPLARRLGSISMLFRRRRRMGANRS
jgi:signal transduction histidine kinase